MLSTCNAAAENLRALRLELFGRTQAAVAQAGRPIAATVQPTSSDGRAKPMRALRVLVVEDDAMIGVLLGEMLEGMGYDVCAIEATEADAVNAAARCRPDLMIVDVQLGEGSGIAAVDAIHRAGPVPHVFVSGDIARLRALRPNSITIQKPYREFELAMVIQRALGSAAIA